MLTDEEIFRAVDAVPITPNYLLGVARAIESAALAKAGVPAAGVSSAYSPGECAAPTGTSA